jgi:cyclopropane fatty-acyl-phospholipid synthase-like methyltransferase
VASTVFPSSDQGVGELYDRFTDAMAATYGDNLHYGYWPDPRRADPVAVATERMTDELIGRLDARPGDRVLDIGCGTGAPALRLARSAGVEVTGITVSRRQLDLARAAAGAAGLADRVGFRYADAMDLPFEDGEFDRAWALESLHHIPDRARVLRGVARVLRPGGCLAIADIVLRGPVADAAARCAVDDFCAAAQIPSLERIDTYPALVAGCGLELTGIHDVTEHTRPTLAAMLHAFRSIDAEAVGMAEAELEEKVRVFEAVTAVPEFGFAFVVARK